MQEIIKINLSDISEPPWRCKEYDDIRYRKLCAMIKQHGQCQTICVCKSDSFTGVLTPYICLSGRNIVHAMLHEKHLVCDCYNMGVVSVVDAMQISLMLNELEFQTDFVSVAELVKSVVEETHVNNAVAHSMFDQKEVKKFMKILEFDWEEFDRAKKSGKISMFESQIGVKEEEEEVVLDTRPEGEYFPDGKLRIDGKTYEEFIKIPINGMADKESAFECEQPDTSNFELPY